MHRHAALWEQRIDHESVGSMDCLFVTQVDDDQIAMLHRAMLDLRNGIGREPCDAVGEP